MDKEETTTTEEVKPEDTRKKDAPDSKPSHHMSLADHFGLDFPNKEQEKKLAEIWEYGEKMSKTKEPRDIMWQVMHLSRTLGAPKVGENPIDRVYRWAKLKRQEAQIQEELRNV